MSSFDDLRTSTTYCFSWSFIGGARRDGGVVSVKGRATCRRSGRVVRAGRLLDGLAFTKAEAEEVPDLLPHLVTVVVVVDRNGNVEI